jgi:hypothetical protein
MKQWIFWTLLNEIILLCERYYKNEKKIQVGRTYLHTISDKCLSSKISEELLKLNNKNPIQKGTRTKADRDDKEGR